MFSSSRSCTEKIQKRRRKLNRRPFRFHFNFTRLSLSNFYFQALDRQRDKPSKTHNDQSLSEMRGGREEGDSFIGEGEDPTVGHDPVDPRHWRRCSVDAAKSNWTSFFLSFFLFLLFFSFSFIIFFKPFFLLWHVADTWRVVKKCHERTWYSFVWWRSGGSGPFRVVCLSVCRGCLSNNTVLSLASPRTTCLFCHSKEMLERTKFLEKRTHTHNTEKGKWKRKMTRRLLKWPPRN